MPSEQPSHVNGEHPREKKERPKAKGKVFLKAEALKSIILFAKRYANETIPEYDWKEVYGFLIGYVKNKDDVYVDSAVPMTAGEATEVSFGPEHYSKAWQLDTEISEKNDSSFVCGWWHTHPFKSNPQSLFLSSIDVYNHMGFQGPNPLSIALVHDPSKIKSKEIPFGVKIFRLSRTDLTHDDLDMLALELLPEGNTRSDENDWVYYEVPFEVVNITPELFFESLVDVFEKTKGGKPIEMAYLEKEPSMAKSPGNLTSIGDLQPKDQDFTGFVIKEELTKKTLNLDIPPSLPDQMEDITKVHVIPLKEFYENDAGMANHEGDEHLENAITLKKTKAYGRALAFLRRSRKIYAPLKAQYKLGYIRNEMMECHYWDGDFDECIIESDQLLRLGEDLGQFYFMGNAQEFKGRSYLKKGDNQKSMHSFQEARKHFENGRIFGKAGTCMEMIGRIEYDKSKPDFDRVALFFTKALQFYQSALRSPSSFDPEWVRNGKMAQHAAILEKLTEEITMRLSNSDIVNKVQSDLSKLDAW